MADQICYRGDTNVYNLSVIRQNAPVNITDGKLWFTAKLDQDDPDSAAYISLNSEDNPNQVMLVTPQQGKAQIVLVPADTDGLTVTALWYDLQLQESTGVITTVQSGILKIQKDVTRSVA